MSDAHESLTPQGGRLGAMQYFYYRIAEEAFVECEAISAQRHTKPTAFEPGSTGRFEVMELEERQLAASVQCIVFAGMCLEGAIYDYASWHLLEAVVEGLDKMDFLSKWRIIPLFIAKHQIPAGKLTHNALTALHRLRNRLVHAKSKGMESGVALEAQLAAASKNSADIASGYIVAMEAIIATSIEMDLHASMTINPLPGFIPARNGLIRLRLEKERPKELAPLIAKCSQSLGT